MSDPKRFHGEAVKRIGRYLLATKDKGLIIQPNHNNGFQCYVDADYCGNWDNKIAADYPSTAQSQKSFIVKYVGVPLYWMSKLQTQYALSTAESEYIGLSAAARYVKGTVYLMKEIKKTFDPNVHTLPNIHCCMLEDNSMALEMSRTAKMRPCTCHLNVAFHHFCSEVAQGILRIEPIDTKQQQADMVTKPVNLTTLVRLRKLIMGW